MKAATTIKLHMDHWCAIPSAFLFYINFSFFCFVSFRLHFCLSYRMACGVCNLNIDISDCSPATYHLYILTTAVRKTNSCPLRRQTSLQICVCHTEMKNCENNAVIVQNRMSRNQNARRCVPVRCVLVAFLFFS